MHLKCANKQTPGTYGTYLQLLLLTFYAKFEHFQVVLVVGPTLPLYLMTQFLPHNFGNEFLSPSDCTGRFLYRTLPHA